MDEKIKCTFVDNTTDLTDILEENCQYPDIAVADDRLYACWQRSDKSGDSIIFCEIIDGKPVNPAAVSSGGQALTPRLFVCGGQVFTLWNEFSEGVWRLFARRCADERLDAVLISEGVGVFFPAAVEAPGGAYLAWTEQTKDESRVMLCAFDGARASKPLMVSNGGMCFRPSIAMSGETVCCLYDEFENGQYSVRSAAVKDGVVTGRSVISEGSEWACCPELAVTSHGLSAVWYAVAPGADVDYWSAELALHGGALNAVSSKKVTRIGDWFASVALASDGERDIFVHSKSYHAMVSRTRRGKTGGWSDSVVVYSDDHMSAGIRPRVVIDKRGEVFMVYQTANGNGHQERFASVVLFRASFDEIAAKNDGYVDSLKNSFTKPIEAEKKLESVDDGEKREWLRKNGYLGLNLLFGDIHGQSDMSDGTGQIDLYYNYARAGSKLDFTALTDHDCFTDAITPAEWEYMRTTCELFNREDLTTLLAYEWTSNEVRYDFGHKNVYYPGAEGGLFRACDPDGLTPDRLFANIKKYGGIAIPHHPSATWGIVSAATDWDFHDPEVQRLGEIFSRHAPFEKEGDSIYTKNNPRIRGKYIQDALARGYRIGFTAGSDSHQLEHGAEGGIVAAFVPDSSRESVFSALYNRFVYATTGARILVSLKVNGIRMGNELALCANDKLIIELDVLGTQNLKSVEIVCNNADIASAPVNGRRCEYLLETYASENCFYYVRVTQTDEHQAWSSPVWVDVKKAD